MMTDQPAHILNALLSIPSTVWWALLAVGCLCIAVGLCVIVGHRRAVTRRMRAAAAGSGRHPAGRFLAAGGRLTHPEHDVDVAALNCRTHDAAVLAALEREVADGLTLSGRVARRRMERQ